MGRTIAVLGVIWAVALGIGAAQAADAKREITQVRGDLYRFQNNFHYSVLYVTSEGVIVTDPINTSAAEWLKAEVKKRFDRPIRYVIYSHDHADHISGGEVFANDGAVVVAHRRTKRVIEGEKRPTAVPQVTFSDSMTIELGGKRVVLDHVGKNHSDNSIVMRFPAEGVLFAVDFIPVKAVAYRTLPDAHLPEWIGSLRRVERMNFEILVPGHGAVGTRADVTAFRRYMSDLHDEVLKYARQGKTLEETKKLVDLSAHKDLAMFDKWMPLNVEGAYQRIQMHRRPNP